MAIGNSPKPFSRRFTLINADCKKFNREHAQLRRTDWLANSLPRATHD